MCTTRLGSKRATISYYVRNEPSLLYIKYYANTSITVFLAVGYLFGFSLARVEYLSYYGIFCNTNGPAGTGAAPGECYYYLMNPYEVGEYRRKINNETGIEV
jgi:hypothetical protein